VDKPSIRFINDKALRAAPSAIGVSSDPGRLRYDKADRLRAPTAVRHQPETPSAMPLK
jgi:hypothetical protein